MTRGINLGVLRHPAVQSSFVTITIFEILIGISIDRYGLSRLGIMQVLPTSVQTLPRSRCMVGYRLTHPTHCAAIILTEIDMPPLRQEVNIMSLPLYYLGFRSIQACPGQIRTLAVPQIIWLTAPINSSGLVAISRRNPESHSISFSSPIHSCS